MKQLQLGEKIGDGEFGGDLFFIINVGVVYFCVDES